MTCYLNMTDHALGLSIHAYKRSKQRGIKQKTVAHIIRFGRKKYQNGAIYYSVGRKEIKKYIHLCPTLKEMNGMHLVMSPTGTILTLFRNKDFSIIKHC